MKALTRIIVILVSGFIACLIVILYGAAPMLSGISNITESIKAKKSELATLDLQIRSFKTAQSDLAKATRKDDIANAIVVKESLNQSVEELEAIAKKTNTTEILNIPDATADTQTPPIRVINARGIDEVPYNLSTKSDFAGVVNFLSYLEHLPNFTEIDKIDLSAEVSGNSTTSQVHTGAVIGNFEGVFFIKQAK